MGRGSLGLDATHFRQASNVLVIARDSLQNIHSCQSTSDVGLLRHTHAANNARIQNTIFLADYSRDESSLLCRKFT